MGLFGSDGFEAIELSDESIPDERPDGMTLFHVRPYKETPGFGAATEFVRGVAPATEGRITFEPWFDDARIKFVIGAPSRGDVSDVVNSHFPNSVVEEIDQTLPQMGPGEFVAGARMELAMDCAYPIRHPESTEGFDSDPYKTILPKLIGRDDDRTFFQVTFRPVNGWYKRGWLGSGTDKIAQGRGKGRVVGQRNPEVVQTKADSAIQSDMQNQRPRPAYRTVVRVFAISENKQEAELRADAIADILDTEYDHISDQGFDPVPLHGDDLVRGLQGAARRTIPSETRVWRWLRGPENILTDREVAGLAHLPSASINVPDVGWSRMESGPGAPPGSEQFEFDDTGAIEGVSE